MSFPTGWTKRAAITIDHTKVGTGGVASFAVLLTEANLPAGIFADALETGADIRVTTDLLGSSLIPIDVISFNTAGSTAQIRTKVPNLSAATDTVIYVWYGNATATALAADDTNGRNNVYASTVAAKYAMEENPAGTTSVVDRTANARNLTLAGSMDSNDTVAAKIGNGLDFDGTNDQGTSAAVDLTAVAPVVKLWTMPSGTDVTANFTCTGLTRDPVSGNWWVGDYTDGRAVEVDVAGNHVSSFALASAKIQGLSYDPGREEFWWCGETASAKVYCVEKDGTAVADWSHGQASDPNHLCWSPVDDHVYIVWNTPAIRKYTRAGTLVATYTPAWADTGLDGIFCDPDGSFWFTDDTLVHGRIIHVAADLTTVLGTHGGIIAPEGVYVLGGTIYLTADRFFHGAVANGNGMYQLNYDADLSASYWVKFPSAVGTKGVVTSGNPASVATDWGIFATSQTGVRIFAAGAQADFTITNDGSFRHIVLTLDRSHGWLNLYENGTIKTQFNLDTATPLQAMSKWSTLRLASDSTGRFCAVTLDELSIHTEAVSQAWVTTEYNTTADPATFATAEEPETPVTTIHGPGFLSSPFRF